MKNNNNLRRRLLFFEEWARVEDGAEGAQLSIAHLVPTTTQEGLSIHGVIAEDTDVAAFGQHLVEFILDLYFFHVFYVGVGAFAGAHHTDEGEILGDTVLRGFEILFVERMDEVEHELFCFIFNRMCFHSRFGLGLQFLCPRSGVSRRTRGVPQKAERPCAFQRNFGPAK
jgi:hypothetical protein